MREKRRIGKEKGSKSDERIRKGDVGKGVGGSGHKRWTWRSGAGKKGRKLNERWMDGCMDVDKEGSR